MKERYYSFNRYLQETFGERVHRLSLDAGFKCPNLDGTKSRRGCIFCNNKSFSRYTQAEVKVSLEEQIARAKEYAAHRFGAKKYIAYFQSFTNTYGDIRFLQQQYSSIRKFPDIVGLAISTRPDCIDEERLNLIDSFTQDYAVYIEYGLQTAHNKTLKFINRNHTFADFQNAVVLTRQKKNINIGVHVILGLAENKEEMLTTARQLAKMPLWGIKFHCLHVVKNTPLEKMYYNGDIKLLSEDEYLDILLSFLEIIPPHWVVLRLVSDAARKELIAPLWINNKQNILEKITRELKKRNTYQGLLYVPNTF